MGRIAVDDLLGGDSISMAFLARWVSFVIHSYPSYCFVKSDKSESFDIQLREVYIFTF